MYSIDIAIPEDLPLHIAEGKVSTDAVMNPFGLILEVRHNSGSSRGSYDMRFYVGVDEKGYLEDHIGSSVTVYGPELRWGEEVRDAYVNYSSGSAENSRLDVDATIWLLALANELCDVLDKKDAPRIAAELADYRKQKAEFAEASRKQDELAARRDRTMRACAIDGRQVRITLASGKQIVGTLRYDEEGYFRLSGERYKWSQPTWLELKPTTSKYAPYQVLDLPQ